MKICIEATPIGIKTTDRGGVYRYISKLIEALGEIDSVNEYVLFFNYLRNEHAPFFQEAVKRLGTRQNVSVRLSRFPTRVQRIMEPPAELLTGKFDVFHACYDYLRPSLSGKRVVTIHDVRYLEEGDGSIDPVWIEWVRKGSPFPDADIGDLYGRDEFLARLRATIRTTVKRAHAIITVSEFSRRRIVEKLGVPPERVRVVPHGVDRSFRPPGEKSLHAVLCKYGVTRPYVLYAGKFDPLKNVTRLVEAFAEVIRSADVELVLVGPRNWYLYVVLEKARQLGILNRLVITDFVTDDDIVTLYGGASVFACPSLYEGFGLPLLEAMACGVPIVTSAACSIPEVVGQAAVFVDPHSPESIADGVLRCLHDADLRGRLIAAGRERAKAFTWERTGRETLAVYKEVYGR